MDWRRSGSLLGSALAALSLVGCVPADTSPHRPDVLLITIDTARADRFSFMGPSPVETPAIDALAELLAARGYRTGAFVGAAVLDSAFGLDQGFGHYDDRMSSKASRTDYAERRGEEVVAAALRWRTARPSEPSFVWVHLFDPHYPWSPPPPERDRFVDHRYDGEIAYVDRQVGVLLEGYRALARWKETLVILTADHGESLTEHGEVSHGVFIYDVTMRVPLVIRAPGREPRRVSEPVQLIDVLPTLATLLDLPRPDGVEGRDLTPLLEGRPAGRAPPAYLESLYPLESFGWSPLRGVRDGRWAMSAPRSPPARPASPTSTRGDASVPCSGSPRRWIASSVASSTRPWTTCGVDGRPIRAIPGSTSCRSVC